MLPIEDNRLVPLAPSVGQIFQKLRHSFGQIFKRASNEEL